MADDRNTTMSGDVSPTETDGESSAHDQNSVDGNSRKRKRVLTISCDLCKTRKVKCDRAEPACGWCASHNRLCVYSERKKPGLKVGYGKELEDKINKLEAMLQVLGRRVEDHILHHPGPSDESSPSLAGGPLPSSSVYGRISRASTIDAQSNISANEPWHTPDGQPRSAYTRQPDTMSIHSVVGSGHDSANRLDRPLPPVRSVSFGRTAAMGDPDLPPHDLLYSLADLYFKHINPWSPILDRKATFDALFGSQIPPEPERILLHAIVVTTLRFSSDPRLNTVARERYHQVSKQKVQLYGLENANVRALQALLILTLDVLGSSNDPQGWNLLALIARNIVQLGLGIERNVYLGTPTYNSISNIRAFALAQPKSWIEEEERRRLFWMVFVLDRYTTAATGFDFVIDEADTNRSLPCRYDQLVLNQPVETRSFRYPYSSETAVNKPENLGSFSYHCEVLRIWGRIHRFLRRPIDIASRVEIQQWRQTYQDLDADLSAWLQSLPGGYGKISQLCHSDPASRISNWIMLHAAFVTSAIRLHASAAYPTIRSPMFAPSYHAMQRCLQGVTSLREIALDVVDSGMLGLLGPPFAFNLWVSARLLIVHAATMEEDIDPKIQSFISTLEQMGGYWPVAKRYANILTRILQEHEKAVSERGSHSSRQSSTGNVRTTTFREGGTSKTFTGMRRRATYLTHYLNQTPPSALTPLTLYSPETNELEYLDVFDYFNYPPLQPLSYGHGMTTNNDTAASMSSSGGGNTAISAGSTITGVMSNLPSGFRSPTGFATPNPESDWLAFRPPHE